MFENHPRVIAGAQARVDFYEPLRDGRPGEWTEIDYAEADITLKAADAWDAANGVLRVTVDDALRDRLMDALHEGDLHKDADTVLAAVLAALVPGTTPVAPQ
jgi:hypothetical protein